MLPSRRLPTLVLATTVLLPLLAFTAPSATSAPITTTAPTGTPTALTVTDVLQHPSVKAIDTYIYTVMAGPFNAVGEAKRSDGSMINLETINGNGTLVRDQWDNDTDGSNSNVLIYNKKTKQTCGRTATVKNWGNTSGDKTAVWRCGTGVDPNMMYELGMLSPGQAARQLANRFPTATFTVTDTSTNGTNVTLTAAISPTNTQTFTYTILNPSLYAYQANNHDGKGGSVSYYVKPGNTITLVPWNRMKKRMGTLPGLIPS